MATADDRDYASSHGEDAGYRADDGAVVVGGLSALGAALYGIGIPKDSIMQYETALKSDQFLVIAHGTPDEATKARRILETTGATRVTPYSGILAP